MAIEVSDGFGIVFRAITLNHQTFIMDDIVTKKSALSKIVTNDHKNELQCTVNPKVAMTHMIEPNTKKPASPRSHRL